MSNEGENPLGLGSFLMAGINRYAWQHRGGGLLHITDQAGRFTITITRSFVPARGDASPFGTQFIESLVKLSTLQLDAPPSATLLGFTGAAPPREGKTRT